MTWVAVGVAAVGAVSANVSSNRASGAAKKSANAALQAGDVQAQAAQEASTLLDPFQAVGQQGIDQAGFLTDPKAQFDFLQSNPLFQMSLDNANRQTQQSAASRGRLSAGDTLQQLSNNVLLSASPLIANQKQSIGDLLNLGVNVAGNQGSLRTGQGAALAGGIVGQQNALNAGVQAQNNRDASLAALLGGAATSIAATPPPIEGVNQFNQVGGQSTSPVVPFNPLLAQGGG